MVYIVSTLVLHTNPIATANALTRGAAYLQLRSFTKAGIHAPGNECVSLLYKHAVQAVMYKAHRRLLYRHPLHAIILSLLQGKVISEAENFTLASVT